MGIGETIASSVWVLIPLSIFAIPLAAVVGNVIVKPITAALTRLAEAERSAGGSAMLERRIAELDERLARMERQLGRLAEPPARPQLEPGGSAPALTSGSESREAATVR